MDRVIAPVIPGDATSGRPRSTLASTARPPVGRSLPLPDLPPLPDDGWLFGGMGRLDADGRITDRAVSRR